MVSLALVMSVRPDVGPSGVGSLSESYRVDGGSPFMRHTVPPTLAGRPWLHEGWTALHVIMGERRGRFPLSSIFDRCAQCLYGARLLLAKIGCLELVQAPLQFCWADERLGGIKV